MFSFAPENFHVHANYGMCALGQFYVLLLGSTLSTFSMRPSSLTGSWGHLAYVCNVWSLKH